jgi:hypothetical protein
MADKFSVGRIRQRESTTKRVFTRARSLGDVAVRRYVCLAAISFLIPDAVNDGLTFSRNHVLRTQQASDKVAAISGNLFAPLSLVSITVTLHLLDFYKRLIKP